MGNRLTYSEENEKSKEDEQKLMLCKEEILNCVPKIVINKFKDYEEINNVYESLSEEQIQNAFKCPKMYQKYYLEIQQVCDMAYNEPSLQILISTLLQNKTFYSFTKNGHLKRKMSKKIIDQALKKVLKQNLPIEFHVLINDSYFIRYLNEVFLPLNKEKIINSVEKFLELSNCKDENLYERFGYDDDLSGSSYEGEKGKIIGYKNKFKKIIEVYKKKIEYQSKEKLDFIKKKENINNDDKTCETTYYGFL